MVEALKVRMLCVAVPKGRQSVLLVLSESQFIHVRLHLGWGNTAAVGLVCVAPAPRHLIRGSFDRRFGPREVEALGHRLKLVGCDEPTTHQGGSRLATFRHLQDLPALVYFML